MRLRQPRLGWRTCLVSLGALALLAEVSWFLWMAPLASPEEQQRQPGQVVLDVQGAVLWRDRQAGLRIPVSLDRIAPVAVEATVAAEDQRFWLHPGVDPLAIARALLHWVEAPSGASTITQQLARRLYLAEDESPLLLRKLEEAGIGLQLDARLSKEELLSLYLNEVYYGRGAYGIEAAARTYFGVSARDLDLAQAALLVGLPQSPGVYDPAGEPEVALQRQAYVLDRLVATGRLAPEEARRAKAEPLQFTAEQTPQVAPHFTLYVQEELHRVAPEIAGGQGLVIETTLDASLQRAAQRSLQIRLADLRDQRVGNGAAVVLEPATGHILAMVGSADFSNEAQAGLVNMALQPRQPGSALKPFLYAAALERGLTAATPLLDVSTSFVAQEGSYAPSNYDRRFHGVVPLRVALASSFNVPAVGVLDHLGTEAFLEMLHRVGLTTLNSAEVYGLALTLGAGEVTLLDLTSAYGAIANSGLLAPPVAITRVRDSSGRVLYQAPSPEPSPALSSQHAYLLADILSDPAARQPGFGEVTPMDTPFRAAVKTGTSSRDNWAFGFTADRVVGVWAGNPDGSPLEGVSGVDGAGPVWRDVIITATSEQGPRWLERPPGLMEQLVCSPTGLLPGAGCPAVVREIFIEGTEPRSRETYYGQDASGSLVRNVPLEVVAWALDAAVTGVRGTAVRSGETIRLVQPAPGSVLFLAPEFPRQELVLRAAVSGEVGEVEFVMDGRVLGRAAGPDPRVVWELGPGVHHLQAVAYRQGVSAGASALTFEVRER